MKYVLYHSKCYDGFGAAYAAWKKFGNSAKYIAVSYGYPVPEMPGATEVFIVDFSYPRDVIEEIAARVPLTVLDHHKTAKEALEPLIRPDGYNPRVVFDMERSGAKITWEYLHRTPCPPLIEHISDRDLWQFKLDGTAKIHKALVALPMDFEVWDQLDCEQLKKDGEVCERLYSQLVHNIVESAWLGEIDGKLCAMVNTSFAWSEVGEALLEKYANQPGVKFAASFTVFRDQTMWSLRSKGDFDVSAIAKKFGGGGHKNAAGFKAARY
ncbi:MAG: phosphoesterase [Bdellovibrionales bacterium]